MQTKTLKQGMALALGLAVTTGVATAGSVRLHVAVAHPLLEADARQTTYIKVGLTGDASLVPAERAPVNVAIVIDRSGSMGGDKISRAREAAIQALDRIDHRDIVSVLAYDNQVEVVVPATRVSDRGDIRKRIDAIQPRGSTALFAGVSKGAAELRKFLDRERVNRLVLLSDGLANVGPSSPGELAELGASLAREGIAVTTIGLGLGYNEDLMTRLARAADGNHAFVENSRDLAAIFNREFGDVLSVVARDVTVRIDCARGVRPVRLLGREGEIVDGRVVASIGQVYDKQEKYALLEVEVEPGASGEPCSLATVSVTYGDLAARRDETMTGTAGARYTQSREEVAAALDRDVMVAATLQVAALANVRALELRDAGRIEEARRDLLANSVRLEAAARSLDAPELARYGTLNAGDATELEGPRWEARRKSMRKEQYSIEVQQAW